MNFLANIYYVIRGTPWWVWILFCCLMYRGFAALKTRIVSLRSLFVVPSVFTFLGVQGLIRHADIVGYGVCISMCLVGIGMGWLAVRLLPIDVDKEQRMLKLSGSPVTLLIILFFFAMKYYFGYTAATNPELMQQQGMIVFKYAVYGLSVGVMWGRLLWYLYSYIHCQHKDSL